MKLKLKLALAFIVALSTPLLVSAEDAAIKNDKALALSVENPAVKNDKVLASMGDIKAAENFRKIVDQAAEVYAAISKGAHGEIPVSVLEKSQCIAILPKVLTGALGVGVTHGKGLATCKNVSSKSVAGAWSQPAAISLNKGSIGLQAGAKSTDLVLFFQTPKAATALKKGEFTLGTDVSAVAGKYDTSVDTAKAGVVVYTRTEGAFAGAALTGGKIAKNTKNLDEYYGKSFDYVAILEGQELPDVAGYSKKLTALLP